VYAGAVRTLNIYNATHVLPQGTEFVNAWWDQATGILLHVDFAIKTPTGNAFAGASLVQTNIWSPGPGFGFIAFPNPLLIPIGFENTSRLAFISERGFSGNITIQLRLTGCTGNCPVPNLFPDTVKLSPGTTGFANLTISTRADTTPGTWTVSVNAFSGPFVNNSTVLTVIVVPSGADESPSANINFNPFSPVPGQTVTFSSAGSLDPDGFIVSYNWTFGDLTQIVVPGNTTTVQHSFAFPGSYAVALTVTDSSNLKGFASVVVNVANKTDEPPIADFLIRVANPGQPIRVGQDVAFNASPSIDPDGSITFYQWTFGDGSGSLGLLTNHMYSNPGNYTVTLTVTDNGGLSATAHHSIPVVQALVHDVGIVNVDPEPKNVVSGQQVFVGVALVNLGQQAENVDITVRFDSQVAATLHGVNVPVTQYSYFFQVVWDTTGVAAGNYTISASVFLSTDQNLANNQLTDGKVTVLPPPVLSVTPSQGSVGTKVLVHGSGFPVPSGPFQISVTVEVTFDDQFIGFETLGNTGAFDFVFNVPLSQVGSHQIHAYAELYPIPVEASTGFTVVPGLATVSLTVSVGSIYFPGDTAAIYVLSTLNGSPATAGTISLSIMFPNGTSRILTLQSVSTGVYKASYKVPSTNSMGTYALIATSQQNGASASALGSFEVKPTWLQANGHTIVTGTAIVGTVGAFGVVAFAWRKGYFTKRRDSFPFECCG
jgi:PKD repeat protein